MSQFQIFLESYLHKIRPLSRAVNLAYWDATISGTEQAFDRLADAQIAVQRAHADPDAFARLRDWRQASTPSDDSEARQIALLYNTFLENQIDPALNERMTKLAGRIENAFNVHRATLDGKQITRNEIVRILKTSSDTGLRKRAWQAGKAVGAVVEKDLLTLISLRNEAAESLGFRNYYVMALELSEQSEDEIAQVFDELDVSTRDTFRVMKQEFDGRLAKRFGVDVDRIRPWHYEDPFFQEAPRVHDIDLDRFYEDQHIVELAGRFFASVGLPADDILARSDLYEKPGKDQHAYCTDIDREGDIRILANVKNDELWTGTMLHELGHAIHDKYIDATMPYILRQEAHIFTTEAIAMLFGRLSKDAGWIAHMIGIDEQERAVVANELDKNLRLSQLVFARWSQVMMRFERDLYEDPARDLNALWWDYVERYQFAVRPDDSDFPHWASKNHLVSAPVYYHNYLLGEVLASQLTHFIQHEVVAGGGDGAYFFDNPQVGDYLREHVFAPGARYRWDEMIRRATGEPLTAKYFVEQFVGKTSA